MVSPFPRALPALLVAASILRPRIAAASPHERRFGLHLSEVAIEGNHVKDVDALFHKLKYKLVGSVTVTGWQRLNEELDKDELNTIRGRKAVYFVHGWTHIIDPELVIFAEETILAKESKRLHAKIVVWLSESASDSSGFGVYEHGHLLREVLSVNGKLEAKGHRLSEERKINWKNVSEEEIVALAHRLGPGFDPDDGTIRYRVDVLEFRP